MSVTVSQKTVHGTADVPVPHSVAAKTDYLAKEYNYYDTFNGVHARDFQEGDLVFVHRFKPKTYLANRYSRWECKENSRRHGLATVVKASVSENSVDVKFASKVFDNAPAVPVISVSLFRQPVHFLASAKLLNVQDVEALAKDSLVYVGPTTPTAEETKGRPAEDDFCLGSYGMGKVESFRNGVAEVLFHTQKQRTYPISLSEQDLFVCELASVPPRPLLPENEDEIQEPQSKRAKLDKLMETPKWRVSREV